MAAGGGAKGEKGGRQPEEGERRRALQPRGITGVNLRSETSDGRVEEKVNTVTATPGHPEILLEAKWRATLRQSLSRRSPPWADFNSE